MAPFISSMPLQIIAMAQPKFSVWCPHCACNKIKQIYSNLI